MGGEICGLSSGQNNRDCEGAVAGEWWSLDVLSFLCWMPGRMWNFALSGWIREQIEVWKLEKRKL
jgi:hypothetical protein